MNEVQDVKEVFGPWNWTERVERDPKRMYGFLLCADEHRDFIAFLQSAWRTLDHLSGPYCDIFTVEKWEMPNSRFSSRSYMYLRGGTAGEARIASGDGFGFPGQHVAVDNGIMLPNRTQCFQVRDLLFVNPSNILLPGLAFFANPFAKETRYYACGGLSENQLSQQFQIILGSAREAYTTAQDRFAMFDDFVTRERSRRLKERILTAFTKVSIKDIFEVLKNAFHLALPKTK